MSLLKQKSFSHQRIGYVSFWANFPDFQVTTFSAGTTAAWCSDHVAHHSTAIMAQWWKCHSKVLVWEMIPVVLSFSVFPKLMNYTVPLHKDCAWTPRFCICIWKNAVHPEKQGDITVARGGSALPSFLRSSKLWRKSFGALAARGYMFASLSPLLICYGCPDNPQEQEWCVIVNRKWSKRNITWEL